MTLTANVANWKFDYRSDYVGNSLIIQANCFEWLKRIPENSIHAFVTDPPYVVKEYEREQLDKRANGSGGVWRIPPSFDGHSRAPLPRFTALSHKERQVLTDFFTVWARLAVRALLPGGHVIIASNAFLSQAVFSALIDGGLEFRGELIRVVRTLRGGDRPKNAEEEFSNVSSLPRGCYEPWGIFRKTLPIDMTLRDCLRKFQTGGLRRLPDGKPFEDLIFSERTPKKEKEISNHPSCKPQSFMRQVVYAVLPMGEGIICDPFMGSGSTLAAAEAVGACCVGLETRQEYYDLSRIAIPRLAAMGTKLNPALLLL